MILAVNAAGQGPSGTRNPGTDKGATPNIEWIDGAAPAAVRAFAGGPRRTTHNIAPYQMEIRLGSWFYEIDDQDRRTGDYVIEMECFPVDARRVYTRTAGDPNPRFTVNITLFRPDIRGRNINLVSIGSGQAWCWKNGSTKHMVGVPREAYDVNVLVVPTVDPDDPTVEVLGNEARTSRY